MSSNRILGLTIGLSVVGLAEAAAARPCLLGPDDRPVATREVSAPQARAKGHEASVHGLTRTPGPCEAEPAGARTMLNGGKKPTPRMLSPQRDDH